MDYVAKEERYDNMIYRRCGRSGLKLPVLSLGLWHNFGSTGVYDNMRAMCRTAFDNGITHFDLANNYGPEYGSAEKNFGRILKDDLGVYRDEIIVSSKAGYDMWKGPYGDWSSRKYLIASLDQSLQRLGLDYVDIFYHHRMDPETPLEETMGALADIVRSGKALYAGISNYDGEHMIRAAEILEELHCPFVINQNRYSIFDRTIENNGLKAAVTREGKEKGLICFSPLAHGREARADPQPERDRGEPRPVTGADGARVAVQGQRGDVRHHRRVPPGADPRQSRHDEKYELHGGGAGGD